MNQLNSIEPPVPAVPVEAAVPVVAAVPAEAVICEATASTTSSTSTVTCDAAYNYQTTPDECLPVAAEQQPTPILKIIGGTYKGKKCTVLRQTAKMVEIQILGDTRTRRIMKTSLLWV